MEYQVDTGNKNSQQIGQNSFNQSFVIEKKPKINYWMFSTFILTIVLIVLLILFFSGNKQVVNTNQSKISKSNYVPIISPTPTIFSTPIDSININTAQKNYPKLAVFMREGIIYAKNLINNQETKISRTPKVHLPNLSSNGKYVIYFSITHDFGGFPRTDVFIADINGGFEKKLGYTNELVNKISWSTDGNYVGLILFAKEHPSHPDFHGEALLYDATTQKEIIKTRINLEENFSSTNQYDVNFNCSHLETKYISFCYQFVTWAKTPTPFMPRWDYKKDYYKNSIYTKAGYKLIRSSQITDELVVLEYYTGESRNPESQWGIAGGVFLPGYDEGVTQTYTLLINEKINKVIVEIPNAVETKFLF